MRFVAVVLYGSLMLLPALCFSQTGGIRGTVTDATTGERLPFASVYVNRTTIGTNANADGNFELDRLSPGTYDIMISFIGYEQSKNTIKVTAGRNVVIQAALRVNSLKTVEITATKDEQWFRQLEKFKHLFLGKTAAAKNYCKISNPYGLIFESERKEFTATSTEPLVIDNFHLGYHLQYDLKNFSVSRSKYFSSGFVRFEEMHTTDSLLAQRWARNRVKAYRGSLGHFMDALIHNTTSQSGYELYDDRSGLKQIVRQQRFVANLDKTIFPFPPGGKVVPNKDSSVYEITLPKRLEIHYKNGSMPSKVYWDVSYPISWIELQSGKLRVSSDGTILNALEMTLSGDMLDDRVVDMLPANYRPNTLKTETHDVPDVPATSLSTLTEKAYLHTDKSYYYPGEDVWFKAYMMYKTPLKTDSLSHVLHVDLIDKDKKVVISKSFRIDRRTSIGDLKLAWSMQPGDYTLRAFTSWMLNFDNPAFVFAKPIRILALNQSARKRSEYKVPENSDVTIESKGEYNTREAITLGLHIQDDFENLIAANVSISVTDIDQAWPASNELSISKNFNLAETRLVSFPTLSNPTPIQYGFDVSGWFVSAKGKAGQGKVTLVQGDRKTRFVVSTDKDGRFNINNLLISDTTKIDYVAQGKSGVYGFVKIDSTTFPTKVLNAVPTPPLLIDVYEEASSNHLVYNSNADKTTILKEVTIKDKPITSGSLMRVADYELTGETLAMTNAYDLLSAMQARLPGFRIITLVTDEGPKRFLVLSGPSSFTGIVEPLVLVDGIPLNNMNDTMAEQIATIRPNEVDRVEVNKFGNSALYGVRGGGGVILIYTRHGLPPTQKPTLNYDENKLVPLKVRGFTTPGAFQSPDYSNSETDKTSHDGRTTIYWNPNVDLNDKATTEVSFYAADNATRYRITVEGVSANGSPIHGEKIINVIKAP